jgi:hypothetical protein
VGRRCRGGAVGWGARGDVWEAGMAAIPGWNRGRGWRSARGGGDGGDYRLESGEGIAEREGRRGCRRFQVGIWGGDGGARGEVVVCGNGGSEGGRGAGDGEGVVRRGEATGAEVFTYQVCSSLHSF